MAQVIICTVTRKELTLTTSRGGSRTALVGALRKPPLVAVLPIGFINNADPRRAAAPFVSAAEPFVNAAAGSAAHKVVSPPVWR